MVAAFTAPFLTCALKPPSNCFRWSRTMLAAALIVTMSMAMVASLSRPAHAQVDSALSGWSSGELDVLVDRPEIGAALEAADRVAVIVEFLVPSVPASEVAEPGAIREMQDQIIARTVGSGDDGGAGSFDALAESRPELSLQRMTYTPMFALRADPATLQALARDPAVVRIYLNRENQPALTTSLGVIGMPAAYAGGATGAGQTVAVLDTGGWRYHEFLFNRIVSAACYSTHNPGVGFYSLCPGSATSSTDIDSANDCRSDLLLGCGHGTHVAGTAAGWIAAPRPGFPPSGVARDARIISINVFTAEDRAYGGCPQGLPSSMFGCVIAFTADIITGLERVYELRNDHQIAAVNMSIQGGRHATACSSDPAVPVVNLLRGAGIAVVAAAGNSAWDNEIAWPSCLPGVVAVGNTTNTDGRSPSSNWGPLIDIAAPGTDIVAPDVNPSFPSDTTFYAPKTGTSMSSPHVAGAFAVIRSQYPNASIDDILAALVATGTPITAAGTTVRRMNVDLALAALAGPQATTTALTAPTTGTVGQNLTFSASVTAHSGTPTGTVSFRRSGTQFATATLNAGGTAQVNVSNLPAGTHSITAHYLGSGGFAASASPARSVTITGTQSTTTLAAPASSIYGQSLNFQATVTAPGVTPTGTVSFRRDGTQFATAQLNAQGMAAASASNLPAGNHQITAVYLGGGGLSGSSSAARSLVITPATQTITFAAIPDTTYATGRTVALSATASSGLPVSFASLTDGTCTVTGSLVTLQSAGTCTVRASRGIAANYNAATPVDRTFQIARGNQTITFPEPGTTPFSEGRIVALSASASSGLAVDYQSRTPDVCTVSDRSARAVAPGRCVIEATQGGNTNFNAALSVSTSFLFNAVMTNERQANRSSRFDQGPAAIAPLGVRAVMAFADRQGHTGLYGISAQRLRPNGTPLGPQITVAEAEEGVGAPHVAEYANGFVVVWHGPDGSDTGIFAQRYRPNGQRIGRVIAVNVETQGTQAFPRVASLPGGGFAVVWQTAAHGPGADIALRLFNNNGSPRGPEQRVNENAERDQITPDIAVLEDGRFAVVWGSEMRPNRFGVMARLFRPNGNPQGRDRVVDDLNQVLQPSPVIAARSQGGYAIAYDAARNNQRVRPSHIMVRRMAIAGGLLGPRMRANSRFAGHHHSPTIAALRNGAFVVGFSSPTGNSHGIALRLFGSAGTPLGEQLQANAMNTGNQDAPDLAPIGRNNARGATFLGVWTTPGAGANQGSNIAARRFRAP